MNNNGSAVVVVLLFLGVVSMIGAGLILQNKLDVQFNSAIKNVDSMQSLADAGAAKSFQNLPKTMPKSFSGDPVVVGDVTTVSISGVGKYKYRGIFVGPGSAIASCGTGNEASEGSGYGEKISAYYWIAQGSGQTAGGGDTAATVEIACHRCTKE